MTRAGLSLAKDQGAPARGRLSLVRAWPLLALLASGPACDQQGSPASPSFEPGEAGPGYVVCPSDIDASFGSIYAELLSAGSSQLDGQQSCGANVSGNCHSSTGASSAGTGNLLDFSRPARGVYAEFLHADGGLVNSTNLAGDAKVPRVVPFDAGASMLYVKLTLTTTADPTYGSGMPLTAPGSVCPATLEAVKQWIDQGAVAGDLPADDAGADAGADAAGDATTDAGGDGEVEAAADGGHDATAD
jgi:hypothetical protein